MPRELMSYQCTVCSEVYPMAQVASWCEDLHADLRDVLSSLPKGTLLTKIKDEAPDGEVDESVYIVEHVTTLLIKQRPTVRLVVSSVELKALANIANQTEALSVLPPMLFVLKDEEQVKRLFTDFAMTGVLVACNFRLLTRKEQQAFLKFSAKQTALLAKFTGGLEKTKLMPLATMDTSMMRDKDQAPC